MSVRGRWYVLGVSITVLTLMASPLQAQPFAPLAAEPGSPAAIEGAALAAEADKLLKEGGDTKAPGAMILAERGAELGDRKAYAIVAFIYHRTGIRPKRFPVFVGRFLRLSDDFPLEDPLTGHARLMRGIVKHGDIPVVEQLLGEAVTKGDPSATFHMGMLRFVAGEQATARQLLDRSAAAGNPRATVMIGRLFGSANPASRESQGAKPPASTR